MTKAPRSMQVVRLIRRPIANMPAESIAPGSQNFLKFDTAQRVGDTERGVNGCKRTAGPQESVVDQMAGQQALGLDGLESGGLFTADAFRLTTARMERAAAGRITWIRYAPRQDDALLSPCRVQVEGSR